MTRLAWGGVVAVLFVAGAGHADPPAATPSPPTDRAVVDKVAVRFFASETGGPSRPRFVTERTLAFETRLEALAEETFGTTYQERHVRAALEHDIAEELLSSLQIQSGHEPPDLPKLADDARVSLVQRVGGAEALRAAAEAEGIDGTGIDAIVRRQARAAYYIDREIAPILHPSEEQLREVYRTSSHPFKGKKFEDVRVDLERWFVSERLRLAESAFLQAARNRVKIVIVAR